MSAGFELGLDVVEFLALSHSAGDAYCFALDCGCSAGGKFWRGIVQVLIAGFRGDGWWCFLVECRGGVVWVFFHVGDWTGSSEMVC